MLLLLPGLLGDAVVSTVIFYFYLFEYFQYELKEKNFEIKQQKTNNNLFYLKKIYFYNRFVFTLIILSIFLSQNLKIFSKNEINLKSLCNQCVLHNKLFSICQISE